MCVCVCVCVCVCIFNPCWCLQYVSAFVKLLITFSILMYIIYMYVLCLFITLSHRVGALQISIIIIILIYLLCTLDLLCAETVFRDCTVRSISAVTHDTILLVIALPEGCRLPVPIGHHVQIKHKIEGMWTYFPSCCLV